MPDAIGAKNPDLRIDGKLTEVKSPISKEKSAIRGNIRKAAKQAEHVIIDLHKRHAPAELEKIALNKFDENKGLLSIEFRHKGHYDYFPR